MQGAREIFAKAYAVWAAVKQHNEERSDIVGSLLKKSLTMRAADPSIDNDIGIEYRKLRDYQAALAAWGKALELDPGYGTALYNLALVHQVELRDPQAAIPLWHRAIAAGEDSAEAYSHLANAYNLSKNPSEGLRWLRRVLERYPDSPQARQVREMMRTQEERL